MKQKINLFGLLLLLASSLQASVLLKVSNIHEVKGNIMIGLYRNQHDLELKKGCLRCKGYKQNISSNETTTEIRDLEPGWYMIAVYHDVNSNEELDTNIIGIPTEPYGFSLNKMGMFGPSFEKSKFYYDGKGMNLEIKLK